MAPFHEISAYIAEPLPPDSSNHVDRATGWHDTTNIFGASTGVRFASALELSLPCNFTNELALTPTRTVSSKFRIPIRAFCQFLNIIFSSPSNKIQRYLYKL